MLKTAMLVSAIAISAPAIAQDAPGRTPTTPPVEQTTPTAKPEAATPDAASTPDTTTAQGDVSAATAQDSTTSPTTATPAQPAQQTATTTTPTPPAGQQAATGTTQIAQVVNTEFPSYDKNADGNLDKTEFSSWMVALKTASDPSTNAADPATQTWVTGAFASADTDKSSVVSKDELTKYLSLGAAS